jgi:predicted NBD/HSP70 family sugar kinase
MASNSLKREEPGRSGNLPRLLARIHESPVTRSELTRLTGLNRSTVKTLVAELVQRGLAAEEDAASEGQVGRPSSLVRPSDRPVAIAVNPEIDAITFAAVLMGGRILARARVPLDRIPTPGEAVEVIAATLAEWRPSWEAGHDVVGLGLAVPGIVRMNDASVRLAPHLGWRDSPVGALLSEATGLRVQAANDAAVGARAEWVFGAGRGVDNMIYVNGGSSGIGGGIISGGSPLQGRNGHAGEIGHLAVDRTGGSASAGLTGTLESEVRRVDLLRAVGLDAATPDELEQALVTSTSGVVRREVERQIDVLARVLAGTVNLFDPERIILGGFLGSLAAVDLDRIRAGVVRHSLALSDPVEITRSRLGSDLLMIGAAELPFGRLIDGL